MLVYETKVIKKKSLGIKRRENKKAISLTFKTLQLNRKKSKKSSKVFFFNSSRCLFNCFSKKYKVINCKRQIMSNRLLLFLLYNLEKKKKKKREPKLYPSYLHLVYTGTGLFSDHLRYAQFLKPDSFLQKNK